MLDECLTSELYLRATQLLALLTAGCCVDILRTITMNYELSEAPWTEDANSQKPKRSGGGGGQSYSRTLCVLCVA